MDYIDMPLDVLAERLELCVADRNRMAEQRHALLAACKLANERLLLLGNRVGMAVVKDICDAIDTVVVQAQGGLMTERTDELDRMASENRECHEQLTEVCKQRDALLAALEAVEWVRIPLSPPEASPFCPDCYNRRDREGVHKKGCKLQAALAKARGE